MVKICGIKRVEDVVLGCKEGASALGFIVGVLYKSEDEISLAQARELVALVDPPTMPVLVTHLTTPESIAVLTETLQVPAVQLHGFISLQDIKILRKLIPRRTLIKAVHVSGPQSIELAKKYADCVDMLLLDSRTEGRIGGTGLVHDWSISAEIVREVNIPVVLAGGLNPDNVAEAIRKVKPYGVDANTGTKDDNGFKDPEKVRCFIRNAKGAFNWCCSR